MAFLMQTLTLVCVVGWPYSQKTIWKEVAIAPASPKFENLSHLYDQMDKHCSIFDRDKVLEGKIISGVEVMGYEKLSAINPEMTFVATANSIIEQKIIQNVRLKRQIVKFFFHHTPSIENDGQQK